MKPGLIIAIAITSILAACSAPSGDKTVDSTNSPETGAMLGLRTVIYHVNDLARAKQWYTQAFGVSPYFDQPYYVGFNIGGYELGLDPDTAAVRPGAGGTVAYWGVTAIDRAAQELVALGATTQQPIQEVGGGIKTATFLDPFGNIVGIIENPNFRLPSR